MAKVKVKNSANIKYLVGLVALTLTLHAKAAISETYHSQMPQQSEFTPQQALTRVASNRLLLECRQIALSSALNLVNAQGSENIFRGSKPGSEVSRAGALKRVASDQVTYRCRTVTIGANGKLRRR